MQPGPAADRINDQNEETFHIVGRLRTPVAQGNYLINLMRADTYHASGN